jgi:2,3-bisphosphoglycerate-independent phosphoglycerate mutase
VVEVLVILDGASEPPRDGMPTSLERAHTPSLDALVREGTLSRLRTIAPDLPAGSESAIPALLGWSPPGPVDRGMVEAAAHRVPLSPAEHAWRVDVLDDASERADEAATARAAAELQRALPLHAVHHLVGHRLLVAGLPPLPDAARGGIYVPWREGVVPPRILAHDTVVIAAAGAATGIARLMGADVWEAPRTPDQPEGDVIAQADAAHRAILRGARRVVVHLGAPDEAAHRRDRAAKVAAIEHADRELIAAVAGATRRAGGTLRVCADHGCDPVTGLHDDEPVPCLDWPGRGAWGMRLTEHDVSRLPVTPLAALAEAA